MQEKLKPQFSLTNSHFKFTLIFNVVIFGFYTLYRIYMALQLMLVEKQNFFTGTFKYHEIGYPAYSLFRVFIPIILFSALVFLFIKLTPKSELQQLKLYFVNLISKSSNFKKYFLFLFFYFIVFLFVPNFPVLLKNLNTQYGILDADSYASIVAIMYRGEFNAQYIPDSGLQFGKYYIVTMPTLVMTYFSGIGNLVASYNITITLLIFLTITNISFIFCSFFPSAKNELKKEIGIVLFIASIMIFFLHFIIQRDYFNFDGFLQVYGIGFYGAIGGMYLLSTVFFVISFLIQEESKDYLQILSSLLMTSFYVHLLLMAYFNFILFVLPAVGIVLAILISRKLTIKENGKLLLTFFTFTIGLNYVSFLALDIFPRYSMNPIFKMNMIILAISIIFAGLYWLNSKRKNYVNNFFFKHKEILLLSIFSVPLVYYLLTSGDTCRIEFFSIPLKLGGSRIYFYYIIYISLIVGFLLWKLLNKLFRNRLVNYILPVSTILIIITITLCNIFSPRKVLSYNYPGFYQEESKIKDVNNEYIFDNNGIRITYNKYLIDVIKYFERNNVHTMYFWLVSKTPSLGIYEHGLLQRILLTKGNRPEGVTVIDEEAFAKDVFNLEVQTRQIELLYKNRFVIVDNNFPETVLKKMESSSLFRKVYENKLYKIYWMTNGKLLN